MTEVAQAVQKAVAHATGGKFRCSLGVYVMSMSLTSRCFCRLAWILARINTLPTAKMSFFTCDSAQLDHAGFWFVVRPPAVRTGNGQRNMDVG